MSMKNRESNLIHLLANVLPKAEDYLTIKSLEILGEDGITLIYSKINDTSFSFNFTLCFDSEPELFKKEVNHICWDGLWDTFRVIRNEERHTRMQFTKSLLFALITNLRYDVYLNKYNPEYTQDFENTLKKVIGEFDVDKFDICFDDAFQKTFNKAIDELLTNVYTKESN